MENLFGYVGCSALFLILNFVCACWKGRKLLMASTESANEPCVDMLQDMLSLCMFPESVYRFDSGSFLFLPLQ